MCSKVKIKTIKPSTNYSKEMKQVIVDKFINDNINLSSSIESELNSVYFNKNKYFKVIDRKNIDKLLEEQKLQDSGLTSDKNVDNFNLATAQSILTGEVNFTKYNKSNYYETRTDYTQCLTYIKYKVNCKKILIILILKKICYKII